MELKLNGWKAGVVILAVIGWGAFRYTTQTKTMETQGVEVIQNWLQSESARALLPEMEKAMQNPSENQAFLEQSANDLQQENFVVSSIKRHGVGDRTVARVDVLFKGTPSTRYLKMTYSTITGWQVGLETTQWAYYLAGF